MWESLHHDIFYYYETDNNFKICTEGHLGYIEDCIGKYCEKSIIRSAAPPGPSWAAQIRQPPDPVSPVESHASPAACRKTPGSQSTRESETRESGPSGRWGGAAGNHGASTDVPEATESFKGPFEPKFGSL